MQTTKFSKLNKDVADIEDNQKLVFLQGEIAWLD